MEGYFTLKFLFATEKFFFRTAVLHGGSSVKKLTELYDLTKLISFGLCWYRLRRVHTEGGSHRTRQRLRHRSVTVQRSTVIWR